VRPAAYYRPDSLQEVWRILSAEEEASLVAGGTDLLVRARQKKAVLPPTLVSLRRVAELRGIEEGETFRIGPLSTMAECAEHPGIRARLPALSRAAGMMGSVQIRNLATVGGNLCNASPCAEIATPLLVHGARVEIADPSGRREVPLEELFRGPGLTCLERGEVLASVLVDAPPPESRALYQRRGRVRMDLAQASLALRVELEGGRCRLARAAAGAVAPTPLRLPEVEALLEGERLSPAVLDRAVELAEKGVRPISDLRAGAAYRRHMVGVFTRRGLERLAAGGEA
jgi:carbon-monoxide dehydrogenase medium subunit